MKAYAVFISSILKIPFEATIGPPTFRVVPRTEYVEALITIPGSSVSLFLIVGIDRMMDGTH